ncbi:repeat set, removed [Histoplasma ohiense]|nr:repeat set, removed [Histoplasma ohiense (nom. inval.)]
MNGHTSGQKWMNSLYRLSLLKSCYLDPVSIITVYIEISPAWHVSMPFGRLLKHGRCPCFLRDIKPIQTNKYKVTTARNEWVQKGSWLRKLITNRC